MMILFDAEWMLLQRINIQEYFLMVQNVVWLSGHQRVVNFWPLNSGIIFETPIFAKIYLMLSALFSFQWIYALIFAGGLHPMHVSVTEIEYDEKSKALEVMMRIFIDDTETLMRERLKQPELDIMNPGTLSVDKMLGDYMKTQFAVSLDNKAQTVKYLGHEKDGEVFIVYMEVTPVKKWKTITVKNEAFIDIYDDQSNLVHVTVRGTVRSMRLTRSNTTDNLTFEVK